MALHSGKPGFGLTTLDLEPNNALPDVSEDIQQALSRLLVFDTNNNRWVPVTGNTDGALLVTFSAPTSQAPAYGNVLVPVAAGIIFNANPLRKQLVMEFTTSAECYIGFNALLTVANGFLQAPGSVLSIDNYTGPIWGIAAIAFQFIRWMEF
jgi:hypothetical protein